MDTIYSSYTFGLLLFTVNFDHNVPPPPPPPTIAGVKFIVVSDTKQQKVEELLAKIYELYSDFVLKNPFYSVDMPIRYEWTTHLYCTI